MIANIYTVLNTTQQHVIMKYLIQTIQMLPQSIYSQLCPEVVGDIQKTKARDCPDQKPFQAFTFFVDNSVDRILGRESEQPVDKVMHSGPKATPKGLVSAY